RAVKNGARDFNYDRWNAESCKNAARHIGRDTRVQRHAEEPLELDPDVRFVVPPGGIIVFPERSFTRQCQIPLIWSAGVSTSGLSTLTMSSANAARPTETAIRRGHRCATSCVSPTFPLSPRTSLRHMTVVVFKPAVPALSTD